MSGLQIKRKEPRVVWVVETRHGRPVAACMTWKDALAKAMRLDQEYSTVDPHRLVQYFRPQP